MRSELTLLVAFSLLLAALPQFALADGMMFVPRYDQYVYAPSQKAAIVWDGSTETMILSTKVTMNQPQNLAWVVPIQSSTKPEVSAGDVGIFYNITTLLSPPPRNRGGFFGATMGAMNQGTDGGVEVLEEKKVDIYDIAILKATSASVLIDWLNANGFNTTQNTEPVLQYYVDQDNFYFIANKIDLTNVYANLTFTQVDANCADAINARYQGRYYGMMQTPESLIDNMFSGHMTSEFNASCTGASKDSVTALYKLKSGISTPLKIIFKPDRPFYPMKMTSLSNGQLTANVYLFSNAFFKDSSPIMKIDKMVSVNANLKQQLGLTNEVYLTSLTFTGPTSNLTTDSTFETTPYDTSKDPYYVSPMEILAGIAGVLLMVPILMLYLWPAVLLPIFAGGILGWLLRGRKKAVLMGALVTLIIAELLISMLFLGLFNYIGSNVITLLFLLVIIASMTIPSFVATNLKWKRWKRVLAAIIPILIMFAVFGLFMGRVVY